MVIPLKRVAVAVEELKSCSFELSEVEAMTLGTEKKHKI